MDKSKLSNDELIALNHPADELDDDGAATPAAGPAQATEAVAAASEATDMRAAEAASEAIDPAADPASAADPTELAAPNTRAQLRASRRNEDRLQRELRQAQQALADAIAAREPAKATPAASTDDDDIDEVIAELENDLPQIAKVGKKVKRQEAEIAELRKTVTELSKRPSTVAATAAEPEFVPEQLDAELQDVVDDMPELYAWQHDRNQTKYNLAGRFNDTLLNSPKWKDSTVAERFAEVVRLVKDHSGDPPPKKGAATVEEATAAIKAKAKAAPVSVGDLRGRTPPTQIASRRADWATKTNDQILAEMQDG